MIEEALHPAFGPYPDSLARSLYPEPALVSLRRFLIDEAHGKARIDVYAARIIYI